MSSRRPVPRRVLAFTAAVLTAAVVRERSALACAVCASGSPSPAPQPSPAALSVFLDARAGEARVANLRVAERRLETGLSYSVSVLSAELGVDIGLPVLFRTVSAGASALDTVAPGDLETRLRYLARRTRTLSLSIFLGAKWPTAPVGTFSGVVLPSALQPGCSSIAPFVGASAARTEGGWTIAGAGQVLLPFSIRDAPHPGDSVRLAGGVERRLASWISTRVTLTLRAETGGALAGGVSDPNSGGAVFYVATETVLRPAERVTGTAGVTFPAVQGWLGERREGPVAALSLTLSL